MTERAHPILETMRALGAATREEALLGIAAADREQLIDTLLAMKRNLVARPSVDAPEPVLAEAGNG